MAYYDWAPPAYQNYSLDKYSGFRSLYLPGSVNLCGGTGSVHTPTTTNWRSTSGFGNLAGTCSAAGGVAIFTAASGDELTTAAAISSIISAAAYAVHGVVEVASCNTTSATVYNNDLIFGDQSGFFGLHVQDDGAGTSFTLRAFHWDGAAKSANVAGLSYGTPYYFAWRYNGTNLTLQVDSGTEASTAAGNISTVTGGIRMGGTTSSTAKQLNGTIHALGVCNATQDAARLANQRLMFEAIRDDA
jgi:hypothetical protein